MDKIIQEILQNVESLGFRPHSYPLPIGLTLKEQAVLAAYAFNSPIKTNLVEIGAFFGGSSAILVGAAKLGFNKVVSIDIFQDEVIDDGLGSCVNYHSIMSKCEFDNYALINTDSTKSRQIFDQYIEDKDIGLLFIDGSHIYKDCKADFYQYEDLIVKGGYVLFHDCGNVDNPDTRSEETILKQNNEYDVTPFVQQLMLNNNYELKEKPIEQSIAVFQKIKE